MAVPLRHLIQPDRVRSKKRPLARCGCGSTPKISGISHGFSSMIPSSLLRELHSKTLTHILSSIETLKTLLHYSWGSPRECRTK